MTKTGEAVDGSDHLGPSARTCRPRVSATRRRAARIRTCLYTAALIAILTASAAVVANTHGHFDHQPRPTTIPSAQSAKVTFEDPGFIPGEQHLTKLAPPRTVTATGTGTLRLGPRPANASAIIVDFTCLSAGRFAWSSGDSIQCDKPASDAPAHRPTSPGNVIKLTPHEITFSINTSSRARWSLTATYVDATTTRWGLNADGQTYGVQNENGTPDLVSVFATNGKIGYSFATQLGMTLDSSTTTATQETAPPRTIPVYKSDGTTTVGSLRNRSGHASLSR